MNGINCLVDTNAVISLLKGQSAVELILSNAHSISISVISVIEFLSFPSLAESDVELFKTFLQRVSIIPVLSDLVLLKEISLLKSTFKLKLPDAVIAQTAIELNAVLITNDNDFARFPVFQFVDFK